MQTPIPNTALCAFVAGATGLAGPQIIQALVAAHVRVVAHVRPDSLNAATWPQRFAQLGAEAMQVAWDAPSMRQSLAVVRPDFVFIALGTTARRVKQERLGDPYGSVDVGLARCLIDVAKTLEPAPRIVCVSSAGADTPRGAYSAARHRVEAHLQASGLMATVARPDLFVGTRDTPRAADTVMARLLYFVAGFLSLVGARRMAAQAWPMTARALGEAMVHHSLYATQALLGARSHRFADATLTWPAAVGDAPNA